MYCLFHPVIDIVILNYYYLQLLPIFTAECHNVHNCTSPFHGVCKTTDVCQCSPGYIGQLLAIVSEICITEVCNHSFRVLILPRFLYSCRLFAGKVHCNCPLAPDSLLLFNMFVIYSNSVFVFSSGWREASHLGYLVDIYIFIYLFIYF